MAFFSSDESVMYYECGYSCDNAILLKNNTEIFFITDERYTLEAKESIKGDSRNIEIISSKDLIKSLCGLAKNIKNLVFNPQELSVESYQTLIKENLSLVAQPNFHQLLRIKKSDEEIALIKKSQKLNKEAFMRLAKYLRKHYGDSDNEKYLQFQARKFLESSGKYALSFNPIFAINQNAAKPHALPTKDRLKVGDLVLFDAGIKYKRYCSDMTRTALYRQDMTFDKEQKFKNKKMQEIYDIVRKAQENAIIKLRAGMQAKEVDSLARNVIDKAGYGKFFTHSLGHGVGLDIHELPRISKNSKTIIEDGMVFSIEPGIYINGEFGVRIEDLIVVRNGKAEIL